MTSIFCLQSHILQKQSLGLQEIASVVYFKQIKYMKSIPAIKEIKVAAEMLG